MDTPDYGIAAMRRGSYDDAAASLRPVSIDPLCKDKDKILLVITSDCDLVCFLTDQHSLI